MTPVGGQPGGATVTIINNTFTIEFRGANPNTLYTIWTDHRNRASGELASDYPLAEGALPRGVAPTFATTAGVTSGMGLDPNAVVTDSNGDATLTLTLDYSLLDPGASPVVGEALVIQGLNRVGGGWLRAYPKNPDVTASLQATDQNTGLPVLPRSTAQGITVVVHPDRISHGHTPGVGGVDHFSSFSGDFPPECPLTDEQFGLSVSSAANRSGAAPLEGATLSGNTFVFVTPVFPESEITQSAFFVDGNFVRTERAAPYDLGGTTKSTNSGSFNTRTLSNGAHVLRAEVRLASGGVESLSATFFVDNPIAPVGDDDDDDD